MSNIRTTSFIVPVCIAVCLSLMVIGLCGCSSLRRDLFFMGWDTYKSTTRIVARKEISRERFQDLIRYDRAPDILSYLGTKDDMDYFVSAHVILRGQKPFHYNRFDLSVFWLPSAQVGFRHHLAYISDYDESVYYDTYASVDALKSQLDQMSPIERSAGHHSMSVTSITVDGGYDVVETPQNVRLVFFLTDSDAAGKRGFVHAGTHRNVSDLVRAGLARELEGDARTVLCCTPPTLGMLAIYQTAPCNSRQDFFEGWFEFCEINPVSLPDSINAGRTNQGCSEGGSVAEPSTTPKG